MKQMTKYCKKCDTHKDTTDFSKRTASSDGLQIWCRKCLNIENKKKSEERGLKGNTVIRDSKTCTLCGQTKPISQFYTKRKYSADGYGSNCKPCWTKRISGYQQKAKNARVNNE